jgi:hypothetical protein
MAAVSPDGAPPRSSSAMAVKDQAEKGATEDSAALFESLSWPPQI